MLVAKYGVIQPSIREVETLIERGVIRQVHEMEFSISSDANPIDIAMAVYWLDALYENSELRISELPSRDVYVEIFP